MLRRVTLAAALFAALPLQAQWQRNFPATALRGELAVRDPLDVRLNGKPAVLAPGARIRNSDNMLVTPGALVGHRLVVHYTRDLAGNLLDIWLLTDAERNVKPWPATPEQARAWSFDPAGQTWTKP